MMSRRASVTRYSRPPPGIGAAGTHEICASSGLNGAALRTCQRISWSRSCAAGTFSNRSSEIFAALSGITSAMRRGRTPALSNAERSAAVSARRSWMFAAFSAGVTTPGARRSVPWADTIQPPPCRASDTAVTRSEAISTPTDGGGLTRNGGSVDIALFDEGHLVDLAERRLAGEHLLHRRLAQGFHAFLARRLLHLGGRPPRQDDLADVIGQIEELAYGVAPLEPGAAALDAAGHLDEEAALGQGRIHGRLDQLLARDLRLPLAVQADVAHEALREHAVQGRDELVGLDAHVQEAAEHVDDVVGVDRREDQVPRQRRVDRDLRRLVVADLADHDLVGVVPQDRPQPARERQPLLLVDRDLRDPPELVFDRVLDRDDLVLDRLDLRERGIQRRRLARPGGPGDEHHAVRLADVL